MVAGYGGFGGLGPPLPFLDLFSVEELPSFEDEGLWKAQIGVVPIPPEGDRRDLVAAADILGGQVLGHVSLLRSVFYEEIGA